MAGYFEHYVIALGGEFEIGNSVLKSYPNIDTQPDRLISRDVTMAVSTSLVNGDRYMLTVLTNPAKRKRRRSDSVI